MKIFAAVLQILQIANSISVAILQIAISRLERRSDERKLIHHTVLLRSTGEQSEKQQRCLVWVERYKHALDYAWYMAPEEVKRLLQNFLGDERPEGVPTIFDVNARFESISCHMVKAARVRAPFPTEKSCIHRST